MMQRAVLLLTAVLALSGCHRREITKLERDEAANLVSEAQFAVTLKEWTRAEGLFAKATQLCPDDGDMWVNLGMVRMRLNDHGGARSAYKSALSAFKDEISLNPTHMQTRLHRAYILVILGDQDDARDEIEKARAKYPDDRLLRNFAENHGMEKMLADPDLKSLSP
jgi:Flp pilus assembly protein TadD